MGPRQSCDAKRASRTARDASSHLVALVGLHRRRAVHEYAMHAMLVVGSEAPCMTRARVYAALVGRVRASQAEGSVDIRKIMMISKAMTFYDNKRAVMGNLQDFLMISELRFLHTYILEIEYAVSRGFI